MTFPTRVPIERLPARRLLAALVEGSAIHDLITVDVLDGYLRVNVNGTLTELPISETDQLHINAGDGDDTITLLDTASIPVSIDAGEGADQMWVGGGDWVAFARADVTLRGGAGVDRVTIDDTQSAASDTTFTNPFNLDTQARRTGAGTLFINAGLPETAVEQIDYRAGSGADDIRVLGLSSFSAMTLLSGDGDDSVTLGTDLDSGLNGAITVDGEAGFDTLHLDDSADGFGDTYFFEGDAAAPRVRKNSGGGGITYIDFQQLDLTAGLAGSFPNNQRFDVTFLPADASLSIVAGTGDDTLTLGSATSDLARVQSAINFDGEAGFDRIDVVDAIGTDAATYTLTSTSLSISGQQPIDYASVEWMTMLGNAAANTFDVVDTGGRLNVTLNGGAGDDLFLVGAGDLDTTLASSVSVVGGAGVDRLIIDDTLDDVGDDTYIFAANALNRGVKNVLWSTATPDATDFVDLQGSANNDTIRVSGASPLVTLRIDAGPGDDAFLIDRTTDSAGVGGRVIITSGDGNDSLTLNSDNAGADANVTIDAALDTLAMLQINAGGRLTMAAGGDRLLVVEDALSLNGQIDMNDQTLLVRGGDFLAIESRAANGYSGGLWMTNSAAAIVSDVAAQSAVQDAIAVVRAEQVNLPVYHGVASAAGDVIVRYTLAGDTNLDRVVGFDDLLALAQTYNPLVGGRTWSQGNFNYLTPDSVAGAVGFDDLLSLAQNYGQSRSIVTRRR